MGLKIETWSIAYRQREKKYLYDDTLRSFQVIKNSKLGWAADPFLFDYKGETFLFVEYMNYKFDKGEIAYAMYDKNKRKFSKFKTIISEDYHMSYPLVFGYDNNIYMLPETSNSDSLYMYKALDFPEKWEKLPPILVNQKLADTTPIAVNGKHYAFTYRIDGIHENKGELLLLKFKKGTTEISDVEVISKDVATGRPGGKLFYDNGRLIRVSQDCMGEYGRAINFFEVDSDFEHNYSENLIRKIEPEEIVSNIKKKHIGIHTYSLSNELEVVDLKYNTHSFIRIIYKILRMIRNVIC